MKQLTIPWLKTPFSGFRTESKLKWHQYITSFTSKPSLPNSHTLVHLAPLRDQILSHFRVFIVWCFLCLEFLPLLHPWSGGSFLHIQSQDKCHLRLPKALSRLSIERTIFSCYSLSAPSCFLSYQISRSALMYVCGLLLRCLVILLDSKLHEYRDLSVLFIPVSWEPSPVFAV